MFRKRLFVLLAMCIALGASSASAERSYYVQSVKAKILAAPSFRASVLGEASRGTKLQVTHSEGRWLKVRFYGKTGYVASLLAAPYKPLKRRGLIKAEGKDFRQSVRRRASTYTSAAAARGLAQDDRRRLGGREKTDYDALESIEAFTVSESEVLRFMEVGR